MSNSTYFVQECPTCGRRLQIRVEYLGKRVVCRHCQGEFLAADATNCRIDLAEQSNDLMRRSDELLQSATRQQARTPSPR